MNAWGQLLFSLGEFYSAFLIWWQDPFMMNLSWRWLVCKGAIPSVVFLLMALCMLTESPSFLVVKGRHEEAKVVLEDFRKANNAMDVNIDLVDPSTSVSAPQPRRPSITIRDKLSIVMGRHLIYTTVVACLSLFTLNFLFYGGLYAIPQVLPNLKLHVSPAVNLMVGAFAEMPGYLVGVLIGNHLSRKNCMLLYLLSVLTSTLLFSIAGTQVRDVGLERGLEVLLQVGLIGNKVFTAVGFLVVYVYVTEVYPTVARTTGGALCIGVGRLGSIVAPTVFENVTYLTGDYAAFFNLTAGLCAVNAMLVLFLPYETQGLVLKDHFEEHHPLTRKPLADSSPPSEEDTQKIP
jgi:putative MFS transporter